MQHLFFANFPAVLQRYIDWPALLSGEEPVPLLAVS